MCAPAGRPRPCRRYASRSRRFTRFRRTAPRSWRLTANPTFRPRSAGSHRNRQVRRSTRLPRWKRAWISSACLRRSFRGRVSVLDARGTTLQLHGQALPPFGASALEDVSPSLGFHPLPEAMRLLPTSPIGLKRPLHPDTPWSCGRTACPVY
jgi:hypothetical protein